MINGWIFCCTTVPGEEQRCNISIGFHSIFGPQRSTRSTMESCVIVGCVSIVSLRFFQNAISSFKWNCMFVFEFWHVLWNSIERSANRDNTSTVSLMLLYYINDVRLLIMKRRLCYLFRVRSCYEMDNCVPIAICSFLLCQHGRWAFKNENFIYLVKMKWQRKKWHHRTQISLTLKTKIQLSQN